MFTLSLAANTLTFAGMKTVNESGIQVESIILKSGFLGRNVIVDLYHTGANMDIQHLPLLLINDGQDMETLGFRSILRKLCSTDGSVQPLLCAAIHCGTERKREYGVAAEADYRGRGDKAPLYTSFILQELLTALHHKFDVKRFSAYGYAGFSLGALSAMDISWTNPELFSVVGLFSASLWWRSLDQDDPDYDDDQHRIMHQQVRRTTVIHPMKFFLQCGNLDETKDRNKNGVIDSIDDAMDLIKELKAKGYEENKDICYLELPDGRHDVNTWGRALPVFLKWAYPLDNN